jgi:hypothetical protein
MTMKARVVVLLLVATAACASTPAVSTSGVSTGSASTAQSSAASPSQPAGDLGELTSAQRTLALHIARTEAWTSQPAAPGVAPPGADPNTWPTNVDQVLVILTTHAAAMQFVGGGSAAYEMSLPVLVIRMFGRFSWVTSGPPGNSGNAIGTVATIVVNATTGQITDTGLEDGQNPALPAASVLYTRLRVPSTGAPASAQSPSEPPAQPPASVSTTVHPTPSGGHVVVTDEDGFGASGEVIDVTVGMVVEFDLQAWSPPPTVIDPAMTMQPSVLSPVSSSSAARTSTALFRAARPGLAYVLASEVGGCSKGACTEQGVTFYIQVT